MATAVAPWRPWPLVSVGALLLAYKALSTIGLGNIAQALLASSPSFVILGLGVMCGAMALRAVLLARDPARRDAQGAGSGSRTPCRARSSAS